MSSQRDEEFLTRVTQAKEELRAATREAHEAISDARAARETVASDARAARETLRAFVREQIDQAVREELIKTLASKEIAALVRRTADEQIGGEVGSRLEQIVPECQKALDRAVERVNGEFDKLTRLILGIDDPDRPGLVDAVENITARQRIKGLFDRGDPPKG